MRTLLTTFYAIFVLMSNIAQAQLTQTNEITNPTYQIDEQATAQAPWKPGSIIAEDNIGKGSKEPVIVFRKFLGVTDQGFYVVQDFYKQSNRKQTDPMVIMQLDQVKDFVANTTPIQGTYRQWFDNGQKWVEGQYQNGKQQGLWTIWYDNGQKKAESQLQDGQSHGLVTVWYKNGQKQFEGHFRDGKRQGVWTDWDQDGKKVKEMVFEAGKLVDYKSFD